MTTSLSLHGRVWRATAFALRLVCFALLVLMFSFKLRDFLRQPVVSETNVIPASLPALTICPSAMNSTALKEHEKEWKLGSFTTEEVLRAAAEPLGRNVLACTTANGDSCTPGGKERNTTNHGGISRIKCSTSSTRIQVNPDERSTEPNEKVFSDSSESHDCSSSGSSGFKALWQSRRVPPGITCHTLKLSSAPGTSTGEILLTLALRQMFSHPKNGYYRVFFHAERSPKTWYGDALVSPYHLVLDVIFQELVLTRTEMLSVDRPKQRCQPDDDYDFNQCLLDCRSLATFTEANCSVQWGADTGGLPPCTTKAEYYEAVGAWQLARPDCTHCLRPCRTHSITLMSHPAMSGFSLQTDLQVRFDPQQLLVEQRFAYTLVDLLVDLGGTLGLLLGYSLMSLVDLLDTAIAWIGRKRRRQEPGGTDAAPADAPVPGGAVRYNAAPGGLYSESDGKVVGVNSITIANHR